MMLPSLILFSISYLLWEGHSLGWKLSIVVCGLALFIVATNSTLIYAALPVGLLSLSAIVLEIRKRKSPNKHPFTDSPITVENIAKFGLVLSVILCVSVLVVMMVFIIVMASPFL